MCPLWTKYFVSLISCRQSTVTTGGLKGERENLKKKKKRWRETGKERRGTISVKLAALFTVVISRIIITTVHTMQGGDYTRPLNHFGLYFNTSSTTSFSKLYTLD